MKSYSKRKFILWATGMSVALAIFIYSITAIGMEVIKIGQTKLQDATVGHATLYVFFVVFLAKLIQYIICIATGSKK